MAEIDFNKVRFYVSKYLTSRLQWDFLIVNSPETVAGHKQSVRKCPACNRKYLVQEGGQKSGSSSATWVPSPGKKSIGFCSAYCMNMYVHPGLKTEVPEWFNPEGISTYPSTLAPARRISIRRIFATKGGDNNGKVK